METMFRLVNSIFRLSNRFVYLKISRDRLHFDFDDFNVYHFIQPRKWKHCTSPSCKNRTSSFYRNSTYRKIKLHFGFDSKTDDVRKSKSRALERRLFWMFVCCLLEQIFLLIFLKDILFWSVLLLQHMFVVVSHLYFFPSLSRVFCFLHGQNEGHSFSINYM